MSFNAKLPCAFCSQVFTDFGPLGQHVQRAHPEIRQALASVAQNLSTSREEEEESTMGKSIGDMNRGGSGAKMLHGSNLGKNESSVKIKVKELREAPSNFNSPAILDLEEPVHSCEAFALNITNLKALAALVGMDDNADFDVLAKKVAGKSFTLYKTLVNNPKTKKMTASLFFNSDGK